MISTLNGSPTAPTLRRDRAPMPSYVSLFAGCGGFDLGFSTAGFHCIAAYDHDPAPVATYNHNLPSPTAVVADLNTQRLPPMTDRPDVVIAGPPCQGFSTLGPRNPTDARNSLLLKPIDLAIALRAKTLLIENVPGVLSRVYARYWHEALHRLQCSGYTTATIRVAAVNLGLPQIRRRVLLVAARTSFNPPPPTRHAPPAPLRSVLTISSALPNHQPRHLDPTSRAAQIARHIQPGQKLSNVRNSHASVHTWDIPNVFGPVTSLERELLHTVLLLRRRHRARRFGDADPVPYAELKSRFRSTTDRLLTSLIAKDYIRETQPHHYDLRRTFNGKFRRLHPDVPAHCVLTKFCDPTHFLHPSAPRGFTVREAARVQGFPDSFRFLGSARQQATQVGNAVPPPVATMLARWIRTEFL